MKNKKNYKKQKNYIIKDVNVGKMPNLSKNLYILLCSNH